MLYYPSHAEEKDYVNYYGGKACLWQQPDKSAGHLTRQQLKELEQRDKTRGQKILDLVIIMLLPVICGFIAVIEYWEVPKRKSQQPSLHLCGQWQTFTTAYALYAALSRDEILEGDKRTAEDLRYRRLLVFFLFSPAYLL